MELNLNKMNSISTSGMQRLKETYRFVFLGILMALLGAGSFLFLGIKMSIVTWIILVVLEFIVLFWFMFSKSLLSYTVFTALTGCTLVPVLDSLISAGSGNIIVQALVGTAVITGLLTYYASTTKNNYLQYQTILLYMLIGIIILSIINIFLGSSLFALIISIISTVLFSFFIIADTQEVLYTDIKPLYAAMNIYLDVLNLFVNLIQILTSLQKD